MTEKCVWIYFALSHLLVSNFLLFNILFWTSIKVYVFQKQQRNLNTFGNMSHVSTFFLSWGFGSWDLDPRSQVLNSLNLNLRFRVPGRTHFLIFFPMFSVFLNNPFRICPLKLIIFIFFIIWTILFKNLFWNICHCLFNYYRKILDFSAKRVKNERKLICSM